MLRLFVLALGLLITQPVLAQIEFAVAADRPSYTTSDTLRLTMTVRNPTQGPVTLSFATGQTVAYEIGDLSGPFGYCFFTLMPFDTTIGAGETVVIAGDDAMENQPGCYDLIFDDPTIEELPPGDYTVTARLLTTNQAELVATTSLMLLDPLASEPGADEEGISLAGAVPNPTSGLATVRLRSASPRRVRLDIVDLLGRTVHSDIVLVAGERHVDVDLTDLAPGSYVVRASAGTVSRAVRVVRSR